MPSFQSRRTVPFTPEQMFALVADVEKYPLFLPLCEGLSVRERKTNTAGLDEIVATMRVGYKAIHESFTSRVVLDPNNATITVDYVDGPFKRLHNVWRFMPCGSGTEILFDLNYEFKSIALGLVMGAMFDRAFRKFSEAFEARARVVYG
jgi:coenzyme Q-binding protein COQ10